MGVERIGGDGMSKLSGEMEQRLLTGRPIRRVDVRGLISEVERLESELSEYQEAKADGRLAVSPCKVGDIVFALYWNSKSEEYEARKGAVRTARYDTPDGIWMVSDGEKFSVWRKNIFPTIEEAEAALASLEA